MLQEGGPLPGPNSGFLSNRNEWIEETHVLTRQETLLGKDTQVVEKAENQRTDALELWCWRRLLRVPWTARRSNQSILKEINPEYSLEGRVLKLQCIGHLMRRANSLEKTLMLGKIRQEEKGMTEDEIVGWHH